MAKAKEKVTEIKDGKEEVLEVTRSQIEKQFGKGALMKLGEGVHDLNIKVIPSGCILLDEALGVGGYPCGRIIEIFGPESSGKTTLALQAIAEAQKGGGVAAFIDAEHALDPTYASSVGVDINELWVSQPDSGEQALEVTESLVRSGAVDIIVVDSVAALTPQAEIDGEMGDSHVGLQARLMSQALRKLTALLSKTNTTIIFINQIRMKIGVMFGSPETTTGGNALKFYSSVRIEVRKGELLSKTSSEDAIGHKVKIKIVKNKVAPPFRKFETDLYFGEGLSAAASLLDAAVKYDVIEKLGSWFSYKDEKIAQGRDAAVRYIKENPEFYEKIYNLIRSMIYKNETTQEEAK